MTHLRQATGTRFADCHEAVAEVFVYWERLMEQGAVDMAEWNSHWSLGIEEHEGSQSWSLIGGKQKNMDPSRIPVEEFDFTKTDIMQLRTFGRRLPGETPLSDRETICDALESDVHAFRILTGLPGPLLFFPKLKQGMFARASCRAPSLAAARAQQRAANRD